ncbi:unnamed protein product [Coffea canephora]|uniref:TTI1 N-terminal TPR domain-containing protein n=1 Tax=Coffea canephora TaxID=49390 RepID=A0A068UKA0_COFCA|nr:unnamed protein product [Coffea canephora]
MESLCRTSVTEIEMLLKQKSVSRYFFVFKTLFPSSGIPHCLFQMVVLLKKLTSGALLSPLEAPEEFRAADVEAAQGHRGSATLRMEAVNTLHVLIANVGNADALAFFLPGVISQIGKVLHMSKTKLSGAAGNAEALGGEIRSLAEFLSIVLKDDQNLPVHSKSRHICKEKSLVSFLDELHHPASKTQEHGHNESEALQKRISIPDIRKSGSVNTEGTRGNFCVEHSKDWIINTNKIFIKLTKKKKKILVYNSSPFRFGILVAMQTLLLSCSYTLRESRLLLLESWKQINLTRYDSFECICVLVCDDSEEVSSVAQAFIGYLFSSNREHLEQDFDAIFSRLIDKIPHAVLGNDETIALSHARKLLVTIYFSGPRIVAIQLLHSSVAAAQCLDIFALCLSQNATFSGSLDKLVAARPPSAGYMDPTAEMKSMRHAGSEGFESTETTKKCVKCLCAARHSTLISTFGRMFQHSNLICQEIEECDANGYARPCKRDEPAPDNNLWHICNHSRAKNNLNSHCLSSLIVNYTSFKCFNWYLLLLFKPSYMILCVFLCVMYVFEFRAPNEIVRSLGAFIYFCGLFFRFLTSSTLTLRGGLCARITCLHDIHYISCIFSIFYFLFHAYYVIDSICWQLHHLDLNPHMPSVLAAILSYIGEAHKILPLLEEPIRALSLELEILGRHQHPESL